VAFDLPPAAAGAHPCETCIEKPCLSACPVGAFSATGYDVTACAQHVGAVAGSECMSRGCLARRACPVGRSFAYSPQQAGFHMRAFLKARGGKQ
jgi:Fe-S-cluster-containing hydrogenase component 2